MPLISHYASSTPNCCLANGACVTDVGTGVGLFFANKNASYLKECY